MSFSLEIIFGVVPEEIRAWNPEMAPQAIVMHTNGQTLPGIIGPPPCMNGVTAGMLSSGLTKNIPTPKRATVPILR